MSGLDDEVSKEVRDTIFKKIKANGANKVRPVCSRSAPAVGDRRAPAFAKTKQSYLGFV